MPSGQIKIKDTTKLRIDTLKNSDTYDIFICKMLTYFEETGITPTSKIISPVAAVNEATDRIIKVIRGIEKSEGAILQDIYNIIKNPLSGSVAPASGDNVVFTPEEMQKVNAVIDQAKRLEKENAGYLAEIKSLREKLELSEKNKPTNAGTGESVNTSKIREILNVFDSKKKTTTFNADIYEIPRNDYDIWFKRLNDELK